MLTVITGVSGVLGRATAQRISERGDMIIGVGRSANAPKIDCISAFYGNANMKSFDSMQSLFDEIARSHGKISCLINIAGSFAWQQVMEAKSDLWLDMFEANLISALNACRAAVPHFATGATIVNVGAGAANRAGIGMGPYTASKSALARFTEAVSVEFGAEQIRANLVSPLIMDTPTNRSDMPDQDFSKWATPHEVAEVIEFLSSPRSSGVNGAEVLVAGRP